MVRELGINWLQSSPAQSRLRYRRLAGGGRDIRLYGLCRWRQLVRRRRREGLGRGFAGAGAGASDEVAPGAGDALEGEAFVSFGHGQTFR